MLSDVFRLEPYEKISKVLDLKTAIGTYVKEGMTLFLTRSAEAAACEIIRQFWDGATRLHLDDGFARRRPGHVSYAPRSPEKIDFHNLRRPVPQSESQSDHSAGRPRQKAVEFENWSVLSFAQALMAGALNLPFMPTLSISGSDMAIENRHAFTEIEDPFEKKRIGVIKRFNPDVALYHGWAADAAGNTIIAPYGDDREWAKAATAGVIVTVEKIVSTDFIREHAHMVKIPAYMVDAVCLAPFGAHPRANGLFYESGTQ